MITIIKRHNSYKQKIKRIATAFDHFVIRPDEASFKINEKVLRNEKIYVYMHFVLQFSNLQLCLLKNYNWIQNSWQEECLLSQEHFKQELCDYNLVSDNVYRNQTENASNSHIVYYLPFWT